MNISSEFVLPFIITYSYEKILFLLNVFSAFNPLNEKSFCLLFFSISVRNILFKIIMIETFHCSNRMFAWHLFPPKKDPMPMVSGSDIECVACPE